MGGNMRDKHIRRAQWVKPDTDQTIITDKTLTESGISPLNNQQAVNESSHNSCPNPNSDDSGWGYCTEEQIEEMLLQKFDFLYNEVISKLVSLGFDEETSLRAILTNGHCYGGMDVFSNIMHNSLAYLNRECGGTGGNIENSETKFDSLSQLAEVSVASMAVLLQQFKPHWTRGDAMWCLLMCDLHLGRACMMKIPIPPSISNNRCSNPSPINVESVDYNQVRVTPALYRFHGGWGLGNGGTSELPVNGVISCSSETTLPKRLDLTPEFNDFRKKNPAKFFAGIRANSKKLHMQSQPCASTLSSKYSSNVAISGVKIFNEPSREISNSKSQDILSSLLSKFDDFNLSEKIECVPQEQKDEMVISLVHQIKDLERQLTERKEWAHQKAMQAARKLSNDLTELKMLRMERKETQQLKKGKRTLEETTMKRLSEMEFALRKASGQVDRANAAVKRLEIENAEIRAELEAFNLSASESVTSCLEVAKREKKCLKRLLAWEKQKTKLQEEIAAERGKISEMQRQLVNFEAAQKEAEVKWRQEHKAKELAVSQVEEERCLKEAAEDNNKRKLETLRLKIEIDFQRHKDDLQRLEQELLQLKASIESTELNHSSDDVMTMENSEGAKHIEETITRFINEFDKWMDGSDKEGRGERECLICKNDEASVVLLPCAHQVLCSSCNKGYGKKGKATCPWCRVPIEQRVCTFGASS